MNKVLLLLICGCLLFVLNIGAKEHVYGTKLYGKFIFNDITNKVAFRSKIYTHIKSEETNDGFNMFCSINDKTFMFEVYSTGQSTYIVEYELELDKPRQSSTVSTKATLYYEGIGNILAEDISSNIARNSDYYLDDIGITNSNDRAKIMGRVADAVRLINKGGVKVDASGRYSFPNTSEFAHLQSTGEFKKKWGSYKKDNNYYNNLAFSIISKAIKSSGSSTLSESDQKIINDSKVASLNLSQSLNWKQVLKTEIVSYEIQ